MSRKPTFIDREILRLTYNDGSLNYVLQFTNITWPGVRLEQIETLFVHPLETFSCFPCVTINEVLDQQGNVFWSFPQRGHVNRKYVEPEEQVAAKLALRDGGLQVALVAAMTRTSVRMEAAP